MALETAPREFLSELVLKQWLLPHIVVLNAINLPAVAFKGTDWTQCQATRGGILSTPPTSEETVAKAQSPLLADANTVVELVVVTEDTADVEPGDVLRLPGA